MAREWYIIGEGRRQVGPIPEEALAAYGIKPNTLVWTAGMPEWRRASECPQLAPLLETVDASRGEGINLDKSQEGEDSREVIDVEIDDDNLKQPGGHRIPDPNNPGHWKPAPGAQPQNGRGNPYGHPQNGNPYGRPYAGDPYRQPDNGYPYGRPYDGNPYGFGGGYERGSGKSNIVAGLLAIFLGVLGIQYFYIGKVGGGLLTILLSLVTCGVWSVITLIQGIYMITLPQGEFDRKYVYNNSTFPLF